MADSVDSLYTFKGNRIVSIRLNNVSDGTGESGVAKLTLSGLTGPKGIAPTYTKIREIAWTIQGFTSVRLFWDHTTDDEIAILAAGSGYIDWTQAGGLVDPRSTGGTGNILLTTAGNTSGATYDITLVVELKG